MSIAWYESDLEIGSWFILLLPLFALPFFYLLLCAILYSIKCQIEERED